MQRTLSTFGFSHRGQRTENQDRFVILHDKTSAELLAVVADGLGGHEGGALAAAAVVEVAEELWSQRTQYQGREGGVEQFLQRLVEDAHEAVNLLGEKTVGSPRSTLAALYIQESKAISIHVGDSRVIQHTQSGFKKRTIDHSMVELQVLEGKISEEEAAEHKDQNKLFSSIGGTDAPKGDVEAWALESENSFVLCSDGYWELYSNSELEEALKASRDNNDLNALEKSADLKIAKLADHDNTTAIFIFMGDTLVKKIDAPNKAGVFLTIGIFLLVVATLIYILVAENKTIDIPVSTSTIQTERSDVSLPISGSDEVVVTTEEYLKKNGQMSKADSLQMDTPERSVGKTRTSRLQQYYKGLPVYGAEVIVVVEEDKISDIDAKTVSDINIDTTPELSFEEVLVIVSKKLETEVRPESEPRLVVFKLNSGYTLAWQCTVVTESEPINIVVDASDGNILQQQAVNFHESDAEESVDK